MRITWLSSYPKSGNTWLRLLLHNYIYGSVERSNDLQSKFPWPSEETINARLSEEGLSARLLFKSHYLMSSAHPYIDATAGFIYIYRNPCDVLLSNLNYFFRGGGYKDVSPEQYVRAYIEYLGDPRWIKWGFGTWPENLRSWRECTRWRGLVLSYEDRKKDTPGELRRLLEYLDEPIDQQRIEAAVKSSRFEKAQALEEREITDGVEGIFTNQVEVGVAQGFRFMNKGASGQTLDSFGDEIKNRFDEQFGPVMQELGYCD